MPLSNKFYDALKFLAQILLPALGTLYFALASIWDFPHTSTVVGIIVTIDFLLGILLSGSKQVYLKTRVATGALKFKETEDAKSYLLELDDGEDIAQLEKKDKVIFTVKADD